MAKKRSKLRIFAALIRLDACGTRARKYRNFTSPLSAWRAASRQDKTWCLKKINRDLYVDVNGRRHNRCWCCSTRRMKKMYPRPPTKLIDYFRKMAKEAR